MFYLSMNAKGFSEQHEPLKIVSGVSVVCEHDRMGVLRAGPPKEGAARSQPQAQTPSGALQEGGKSAEGAPSPTGVQPPPSPPTWLPHSNSPPQALPHVTSRLFPSPRRVAGRGHPLLPSPPPSPLLPLSSPDLVGAPNAVHGSGGAGPGPVGCPSILLPTAAAAVCQWLPSGLPPGRAPPSAFAALLAFLFPPPLPHTEGPATGSGRRAHAHARLPPSPPIPTASASVANGRFHWPAARAASDGAALPSAPSRNVTGRYGVSGKRKGGETRETTWTPLVTTRPRLSARKSWALREI